MFKELLKDSFHNLKGNFWSNFANHFLMFLMIYIFSLVVTFSLGLIGSQSETNQFFLSISVNIFQILLSFLIVLFYSRLAHFYHKQDKVSINDGFSFFSETKWWQYILLQVIKTIYVILWSLLLIVPGIIKYISYTMSEFIKLDNPELKSNEAISKSRSIMDGHKLKWFGYSLLYYLPLLVFIGISTAVLFNQLSVVIKTSLVTEVMIIQLFAKMMLFVIITAVINFFVGHYYTQMFYQLKYHFYRRINDLDNNRETIESL